MRSYVGVVLGRLCIWIVAWTTEDFVDGTVTNEGWISLKYVAFHGWAKCVVSGNKKLHCKFSLKINMESRCQTNTITSSCGLMLIKKRRTYTCMFVYLCLCMYYEANASWECTRIRYRLNRTFSPFNIFRNIKNFILFIFIWKWIGLIPAKFLAYLDKVAIILIKKEALPFKRII